ncbi:MAG: hypothetical protein BroJett018_03040 [Chloroflexota bacterium]|nr:TIR domain-containing protein [Chloroflexota bacterium]NOG61901.1 TIR domain-containing protein [Chloroflexota bacterium]GIK62510.1 MAG: hypothetical protein BroJett018_03040 [Chloroflexota bacterium]
MELEKQGLGFSLKTVLRGHTNEIYQLDWATNPQLLASPSSDGTIRIWNPLEGRIQTVLADQMQIVYSASWSPDSKRLVSVSNDGLLRIWNVASGTVQQRIETNEKSLTYAVWSPLGDRIATAPHHHSVWLWDAESGEVRLKLTEHTDAVSSLAWSPDSRILASGGHDTAIVLWDTVSGKCLRKLEGHQGRIYTLAFSPDGKTLVSGSEDKTIRVWEIETSKQRFLIEAHTRAVHGVAYSPDGTLLASKSADNTTRLWRTDTWETFAFLETTRNTPSSHLGGITFHPTQSMLALPCEEDTVVQIWELDTKSLLSKPTVTPAVRYTNAKVVLVGDTGVGKSALTLVLTGNRYQETESTHSRQVHVLDSQTIRVSSNVEEIHEVLLWDLAGQPGYRLIHQLHLHEVTVALVVFDARNEVDPFSGVLHWVRALRQAQQFNRNGKSQPMKIYLVAARVDRGGIGITQGRIKQMMDTFKLDGYFETSAREGFRIDDVRKAVLKAIDWDALPKVSSSHLFKAIKEYLDSESDAGHQLSGVDDLYFGFLRTIGAPEASDEVRAQFDTCIGLLESKGLIKRLSFGDMVLLKPEMLDSYASALVNAARNEPDGMGVISEEDARSGNFAVPQGERLKNRERENILLIATIETLLRHEIALRTPAAEGTYLVFPSQITRDMTNPPELDGPSVVFQFEGPIANIYAMLVVRLSRSGFFKLKETWRNVATFAPLIGGTCGISLENLGEGQAKLSVFFDRTTTEYSRIQFEEFINTHLYKHALPDTLKREVMLVCPECGYHVPQDVLHKRKARKDESMPCPICTTLLIFPDVKKLSVTQTLDVVSGMDKNANTYRDLATASAIVNGKTELGEFDVFMCHNNQNKAEVIRIATKLKEKGIRPWLDEWELRPGLPWQRLLEQQIENIKSVAIFVGKNGIGPWQDLELGAFIREFIKRSMPVIPVILPDCQQPPALPIFLTSMTWVDFRKESPDPFEHLIWGITGKRE